MTMDNNNNNGNSYMIVHPAYDPTVGLWYLESGEEARTLSSLKEKLPPRTKILGYHPLGYSGKLRVSTSPTRSVFREKPPERVNRPVNYNPKAPKPKVIHRAPMVQSKLITMPESRRVIGHRPQKLNHDAILNLWAEGKTGKQIAVALDIPEDRWIRVCQIVAEKRRQGDPRAVKRMPDRMTVRAQLRRC